MRKTGFYADYGLFDTTARQDSALTTESNIDFGDISKAKDDITSEDYATLEKDYFILDGSMPEMPDTPQDVVYFSDVMSDENGNFATAPEFTITFTENHTSYGLTFYFVGDYPLEMTVLWFDLYGVRIGQKTYSIDSNKFFAQNQIENYGKIVVRFTKAKPYRYVKFRYIEYGTVITFGKGGLPIESASLIEECNPISDKISINKLSYKVIDENDTFNIGNINGLHKVLQNGQESTAYEYVNDEQVLLGKFFLSKNETKSNVTSISCVDFKGLLDNNNFRDGAVYDGELAGNVIDAIMSTAGITDYTVTDEVRNTPLYGWLKIQTCRKALREVLFACGAVVDSSRSLTLDIYIPNRTVKHIVKRSRKFSTTVSRQDYVSDVSIKYPVYTLASNTSQIAKGHYTEGTYTVDLSSPASEMKIDNGLILKQTNNYVTFKVDTEVDVIITGKKYNKEDLTITASVPKVSAGNIRNAKSFTCTVLNGTQAEVIAENILNYYDLQLKLKVKILNDGDKPVDWSEVENTVKSYGNYMAGFEKMTTDLTGGFITTAELRGYYKLISDYYYTGELFTGEEIGDI